MRGGGGIFGGDVRLRGVIFAGDARWRWDFCWGCVLADRKCVGVGESVDLGGRGMIERRTCLLRLRFTATLFLSAVLFLTLLLFSVFPHHPLFF